MSKKNKQMHVMELVSLAPSLDIKVFNEMNEWQVDNSSIIKIILDCTIIIRMSGLHLGKMISSRSWREVIPGVTADTASSCSQRDLQVETLNVFYSILSMEVLIRWFGFVWCKTVFQMRV